MRLPASIFSVLIVGSTSLYLLSCSPPPVTYATMPFPVMGVPAVNTLAPNQAANQAANQADREKLAVLPIDDDKLFRAERALLRFEMTGHLARLLPDRIIVPLGDVDAKIRPVSQSTGHICAYEGVPVERRIRYKGWQYTRMLHVAGLDNGPGEELWVEVIDGESTVTTLQGPWNWRIPRVDAYRGAFAAFAKTDRGAVLGGLAGSGTYENGFHDGAVTVCESKFFGSCEKSSVDWQDRIGSVLPCFSGMDEATYELLVQGDVGPYCEMENLDNADGRDAKMEACLCKTLGTSSAMGKRPGRRTFRVHYEAPDLQGKQRPELRLVEATPNIDSEDEWHSMYSMVDGKKEYHPVRRFVVENIDALAAPLSRCAVPAGTLSIADIDVREDGTIIAGKVVSTGIDKPAQTCIEQALVRGAFDCTNDGKSARVRIAMEWQAK